MNCKSFITVVFVWILIFLLAFSYFSLFLASLYKQSKIWFFILTTSSLILITIGSISYFKAMIISPGYVDKKLKLQYIDKIEDFQYRSQQQKQFKRLRNSKKLTIRQELREIKKLTQNSYCQKCDNVKFSRVHHCKQCQTCILRMDHHCPWVGNCIGKHNHKYFLLFLFYLLLALLIVFFSILTDYITGQTVLNNILRQDEIYYYIILLVCLMSLLLILSIGFLLITQLIMIYQNITTLQSFYNGIFNNNPFDSGSFIANFKQVMGSSMWLFPTQPFPFCDQQKNIGLLFYYQNK